MSETIALIAFESHSERPLNSSVVDNTSSHRYLLGFNVSIGLLNAEYIRVHLQAGDGGGAWYGVAQQDFSQSGAVTLDLPLYLPPIWRVQVGTSDSGADEYGIDALLY